MNMIKKIFILAVRYLKYHKVISIVLIISITISIFLPMFTIDISRVANRVLLNRAATTPLVIGGKGAPLQMVLNSLYFRSNITSFIRYEVYLNIIRKGYKAIPVYNRFTAKGFHLVGITQKYFSIRHLKIKSGYNLQMLGDAILGYNVARKLKLKPGDTILSDIDNLYNISADYPLELNISGVLKKSKSPDDNVIFIDVKTAWIIEGIGHGHMNARSIDNSEILKKSPTDVIANTKLKLYSKITPKNLLSFHFHGEMGNFPLTSVLVFPDTDKERRILSANINLTENLQAVSPIKVIKSLMKLIFNIRDVLNLYFAFVIFSTILFLILIFILTLQIRKKEREIMEMIGGNRNTVFFILVTQIITVVFASFLISKSLSVILIKMIKSYYIF